MTDAPNNRFWSPTSNASVGTFDVIDNGSPSRSAVAAFYNVSRPERGPLPPFSETNDDTANPLILHLNERLGYQKRPADLQWEKRL